MQCLSGCSASASFHTTFVEYRMHRIINCILMRYETCFSLNIIFPCSRRTHCFRSNLVRANFEWLATILLEDIILDFKFKALYIFNGDSFHGDLHKRILSGILNVLAVRERVQRWIRFFTAGPTHHESPLSLP